MDRVSVGNVIGLSHLAIDILGGLIRTCGLRGKTIQIASSCCNTIATVTEMSNTDRKGFCCSQASTARIQGACGKDEEEAGPYILALAARSSGTTIFCFVEFTKAMHRTSRRTA